MHTATLVLCAAVCVTAGCLHAGRGSSSEEIAVSEGLDEQTARDRIQSRINALIRESNASHERGDKEVRDAPPYFFAVSEYMPEGPGQFDLTINRIAGNRPQFEASVRIPCHRYVTRYHSSRGAAARDSEFIREEGTIHYSFKLSGTQWIREYSYFEPDTVKLFDGSEWKEVPFVSDRFVEDKPSLWRRIFGFMF